MAAVGKGILGELWGHVWNENLLMWEESRTKLNDEEAINFWPGRTQFCQ